MQSKSSKIWLAGIPERMICCLNSLHPNSFGVFCSFCSYSSEAGKNTFLDSQAIEGKTIANCISSLISVPVFGRPGVGSKI